MRYRSKSRFYLGARAGRYRLRYRSGFFEARIEASPQKELNLSRPWRRPTDLNKYIFQISFT